jgi:hypothetical protein
MPPLGNQPPASIIMASLLGILWLDETQAEWELMMFKGARAEVRKDRA